MSAGGLFAGAVLAFTPGALAQTALPAIDVTAPRRTAAPAARPPARSATVRPAAPRRLASPSRQTAPAPVAAAPVRTPAAVAPPSAAASERTIAGERLNAQAVTRPGEVLEAAPGLIVTQHSGEGKANQYFLRGFNLDHGTDLAIFVDGMPINMRTHGHGQGYADLNFLIPEIVGAALVRKGPYFAVEGDFASAGAVRLSLVDGLPKSLAQATVGSFGYRRALAVASHKVAQGNLLLAAEGTQYDGPWQVADKMRKLNAVVRYSRGDNDNGFSVTAMAYRNRWTSTDQIPARAAPLIGLFGTLDPTDGGGASRVSLSTRWSRSDAGSASRVEAYVVRSAMNLWSNFTYFLNDPVNGDQFHQLDKRTLGGFSAAHTFKGELGGRRMENEIGVQGRFDDIRVGLENAAARQSLSPVRFDSVRESNISFYGENRIRWSNWFRTTAGLRGDFYAARVTSDNPLNSGRAHDGIASPKFGAVFGPFGNMEFFFNAGRGFHSNDARGTTIRVDPVTLTPVDRTPFLVRSQGAEAGVKARPFAGFESTVALFALDFASENLFVGDAGTTEASRPSRRIGVEWTNHYKPAPWLSFDVDLALTRARFKDRDPAGHRVPGAPTFVASAGVVFGEDKGWFGALKLRYFGPRPLLEDNSAKSPATALVNGRIGYRFENGVRLQVDALNLLDGRSDQIAYFYESRLPGEAAAGVADRHFKPVEPRAFRVTLAGEY